MRFYRLIAGGSYEEIQPDAVGIVGSEVLPGLQFRLEDMQRQPDLEELALDDVYSGYVLPGYQVAVKRAEAATAARQAAEHRLAMIVQRAEKEAAARREAEERLRKMKAEPARLRRQSS